MQFRSSAFAATVTFCLCAVFLSSAANSQAPEKEVQLASVDLPEAPVPQSEPVQTAPASPDQTPALPAQDSSSQATALPPASEIAAPAVQKSERDTAADQLKSEEKQRILGIFPSFNTSYNGDEAATLSAGQKMQLALRSAVDPVTFATGFAVAGLHEAFDSDPGFGWGPGGYFKRAGAAYLDAADGGIIGNGILPAVLHQDPRYFRLGHGSIGHRVLYALAGAYICKHDNTRRWEPNYSNVGGNIISGIISNYYYPAQNSSWEQALSNGFIVTTEGTVTIVLQEFWPDISRKLFHSDPTHGLDAQAAARDKAKKQKTTEN
jgi:hypothetical protein